jgi:hypothetical protein
MIVVTLPIGVQNIISGIRSETLAINELFQVEEAECNATIVCPFFVVGISERTEYTEFGSESRDCVSEGFVIIYLPNNSSYR